MTYYELKNIHAALNELMTTPTTAAYALIRNIQKVTVVLTEVEAAVKKLQERYAEKNEDGSMKTTKDEKGLETIVVADDQKEALRLDYEEVLKEQHDIAFIKFSGSKLETSSIAPAVLAPLLDTIITD